jgi:hypothetical protein
MHVLAGKLVGLAASPGGGELPGEAAALAAFVRSGSPASTLTLAGGPPGRRRHALTAGRARLSAAAAAVIVGLSGTAAAAYAGVLPAAVQNFAHHVIGAPAAHLQPIMGVAQASIGRSTRAAGRHRRRRTVQRIRPSPARQRRTRGAATTATGAITGRTRIGRIPHLPRARRTPRSRNRIPAARQLRRIRKP